MYNLAIRGPNRQGVSPWLGRALLDEEGAVAATLVEQALGLVPVDTAMEPLGDEALQQVPRNIPGQTEK